MCLSDRRITIHVQLVQLWWHPFNNSQPLLLLLSPGPMQQCHGANLAVTLAGCCQANLKICHGRCALLNTIVTVDGPVWLLQHCIFCLVRQQLTGRVYYVTGLMRLIACLCLQQTLTELLIQYVYTPASTFNNASAFFIIMSFSTMYH